MTMTNGSLLILTMQTIKKNWAVLLFGISVLLFIGTRVYRYYHEKVQEPTVKTFHSPLGWGYNIYLNDSSGIHQQEIPGLVGRKGFETEEDAKKIGNLVLDKIKHKKLPSVTLKELDSLNIK